LNGFRRLLLTDHSVLVKIVLLRNAVQKGHFTVQRIAYSVYDPALAHIRRRIRVDDNSTINRSEYFLHNRLTILNHQIQYLRHITVVTEVGRHTAMNSA